jgi:hypothetical protein
MKVQRLALIASSLVCFTPLLPCSADPDSDLPLHLQPLQYPGTINTRLDKVKHALNRSHGKHSRSVSTVLQQVHTKISEPTSSTL